MSTRSSGVTGLAAAAGAVVALCVLTACGSSSSSGGSPGGGTDRRAIGTSSERTSPPPAAPAGCSPDYAPRICVHANVTGQTSVAGRGVSIAPAPPGQTLVKKCADLAAGADGELPLGATVTAGGKELRWDMSVTSYHGPGSYNPIDVSLTLGGRSYFAEQESQVKVRVSPDFGTTIAFAGLQEDGIGPGKVSGTIAWTCVDAK